MARPKGPAAGSADREMQDARRRRFGERSIDAAEFGRLMDAYTAWDEHTGFHTTATGATGLGELVEYR